MSWSVFAVGKSKAVFESIRKQFDQAGPMSYADEESVRLSVRDAILSALGSSPNSTVVQVSASGTAYSTFDKETGKWGEPITHTLEVKIVPLPGFVE